MKRRLIVFFASSAYLGYAPIASGTFGTLAGVALYPAYEALRILSVPLYVFGLVGLVVAAIRIAGAAEAIFAEADSGKITIDEVAGYLVSVAFVPLSLRVVVASFFLFRLFDVLKPWPASYFDREIHGGAGVVLDDVVSGVYANAALRLFLWLAGCPV